MISLLVSTLSGPAPELVLKKIRDDLLQNDVVVGSDGAVQQVDLGSALAAARSALASANKESELHRVLNATLVGLERRQELSTAEPKPMAKLEKALKAAQKKYKSFKEDMDGDDLPSKDDKAALKKLQDAQDAASKAIEFAKTVERVKKGRDLTKMGSVNARALLERKKAGTLPDGAELTVLSEAPLVLTLDGWLPPLAAAALDELPAVLDGIKEPKPPPEGAPPPQPSQLCIAPGEGGGAPPKKLAKAIDAAIGEAKTLAKKGKPHDNSTLNLTSAAANYSAVVDPVGPLPQKNTDASGRGCGPLTPALHAALGQSEVAWMIFSANKTVDVLDTALSSVVGFAAIDVEAAFANITAAMSDHDDPNTLTAPDGWDEDEDGEWSPEVIPGTSYMGAISALLNGEKAAGEKAGLGAAYAYSSASQLVRYRAATAGGRGLELACDDFSNEKGAAPALVAQLYAGDAPKGKGGDELFPALGLSVTPKKGRLLLFEPMLPDGGCDPSVASASAPLKAGGADKLLLKKTWYSDSTFDRGQHNSETPQAPPPKMICDPETDSGCKAYLPQGIPFKQN